MGARTTDKWTAFGQKLKEQFGVLGRKPHVKVGYPVKSFRKVREGEKATVGEIAVFQEFGTADIPERSFIRATFDEKKAEWLEMTEGLNHKVMAGRMKVRVALTRMGLKIQSDMRAKIRSGVPPPNATSTLMRKLAKVRGKQKWAKGFIAGMEGASTLIDSGQMLNGLDFVVVDSGIQEI